ncbi:MULTISPECIES: DNA repair protein RecN [unclassified Oceanobacter]|uniref:DNA repair protein RecN n=1 Tax=unclassified Oceanobacter TaxID=2620260 RepID=UPI0027355555|nr:MULTISPECIES: DNA repair protein RecN [unclassified Oceanobacter]MDP2608129.1 DNA repair protein RecN [Oceanobacter sp. 1_MG-2023]MDP2611209.1 DNA repair protein RecN [Oceanobacter sp. 2_MG-2023]
MLTHLSIHQFALVEHLELEFQRGMAVITGETGAGKSILLDALGLALGQRADAAMVRQGAERAEICASFCPTPKARQWLAGRDIPDEEDLVLLRRVVSAEGRSRGYINGRPASANDLRELSQHLIEVHSQHAHQRLMEKDAPRDIVDAFGNLKPLATRVANCFQQWQRMKKRLHKLQEVSSEVQAQRQLLSYQVEELRELSLGVTELADLELEHKRLANAESMLLGGQQALAASTGDDGDSQGAAQMAWVAYQQLLRIDDQHTSLTEARDLMQQAQILLEEAGHSLRHYLEQVDINPHRLQQVEQRLSDIFSMARKHQIQPTELYDHWQQQEAALAELSMSDEDLAELQEQVIALEQRYLTEAQTLSQARIQAAARLDANVCDQFDAMALGRTRFETHINPLSLSEAGKHGIDQIRFMVQTNPGMPAGPLAKVASGGELSRISLAIQVVTAATSDIACLIFDEVDVGIGGGTAERVGRLMRALGERGQVMCVTHQPQVAAQAHQHFMVSKISGDEYTHTRITELGDTQRTQEIARMLGGVDITHSTMTHAKEMLALVKQA